MKFKHSSECGLMHRRLNDIAYDACRVHGIREMIVDKAQKSPALSAVVSTV